VFTGLVAGGLAASRFATGTAAKDADDRIIYDTGSGKLYFDGDGSGSGAQILFALLPDKPALDAGDFIVI
jgi:Ca2+-binding RTX toxin-like protein